MKTLDVVVGGNFGSEAKGHMTQRLAERRSKQMADSGKESAVEVIRVAGPNAGHTGHDSEGKPWAFRQLPVAAVIESPVVFGSGSVQVILGIAAGSEVDPEVLLDELDRARAAGLLDDKSVWVSEEVTLITEEHRAREADADLVARVGSTGKGIGAARADRVMRTAKRLADDDAVRASLETRGIQIMPAGQTSATDMMPWLDQVSIIVEGAQGYGLGLHAGHYPQSTSSDCRAIDFLAMAGINPWNYEEEVFNVWVVARVYPIRVAGNSGELKGETTWSQLGLKEERTTVTKLVRRVGEPDWPHVSEAVRANGPMNVRLAVFMYDQMFPETFETTSVYTWSREAEDYLDEIERETGLRPTLVGTGPNSVAWLDWSEGSVQKRLDLNMEAVARRNQEVEAEADSAEQEDDYMQWWADTSRAIANMVVPKAREYGSRDLVEIGREFAALAGRGEVSEGYAYELGVFFYLRGKVSRWSAAAARGELVSKDTLDDIIAYAMMALHNREESK